MQPARLLSIVMLCVVSSMPASRAEAQGAAAAPPGALDSRAISLLESRRFTDLDHLLRGMLRSDARRVDAAGLLRDLDRVPAYEPPIDEDQLSTGREQLGAGFDVLQSRHFIVLSNCPPAWTRERLWLLERTYDQFFRTADRLGASVYPPERKLLCILIEEHDAYRAFARVHDGVDAAWIAGYYASMSNRVVFYNDLTGPAFTDAQLELERHRHLARAAELQAKAESQGEARARGVALVESAQRYRESVEAQAFQLTIEAEVASTSKTIHEAIHLLAFNCGLQSRARQYPLWITEGFASRFETQNPDLPFGPGSSGRSREDELRLALESDQGVSLETLVVLNHVPASAEDDHDVARAIYAQADSLFDWCFRYERESLAAYLEDLAHEPAGLISPKRHEEMFRRRFADPRRIERLWKRDERRRLGLD